VRLLSSIRGDAPDNRVSEQNRISVSLRLSGASPLTK
jgi:hypothetical protein